MAVRLKEGENPWIAGDGINISENHVISVLLREANNLIHVNEDRELYVDLQLDDGIAPDDDFPVGVTTGKILQEDGWEQSGIILNWKTTSGDYVRLIYANDGNVYIDCGDGIWRLLGEGSSILNCNTRTFLLNGTSDLQTAQDILDWYLDGKMPLIKYDCGPSFLTTEYGLFVFREEVNQATPYLSFYQVPFVVGWGNNGYTTLMANHIRIDWDGVDTATHIDYTPNDVMLSVIGTNQGYLTPFNPTDPGDPANKWYVDQEVATKQDILTAGTRINIQVDPNTGQTIISADVSGVMTYKGNVTDPSALPSSGQQQGDCWYSESDGHLYAWDGTQWKDIGGTGINLNDYFNKVNDDSDDIIQGSTHLFVNQTEKNSWNNKQDSLTAGAGININAQNEISATPYTGGNQITINGFQIDNDAPFEPDNAGSMGQILTKTSNGYEWKNAPASAVTSVNGRTGAVIVDEFNPSNQGSTGQVLKKTSNGYEWANESGGGGGTYTAGYGININSNNVIKNTLAFDPDNSGNTGQVLKKTANGYEWANESGGGSTYYGGNYISIDGNNNINNDAPFTPATGGSAGDVLTLTQNGYEWTPLTNKEANVRSWNINTSGTIPSSTLEEITEWLVSSGGLDLNSEAILKDTATNDLFSFVKKQTSGDTLTLKFLGNKRITQKYTDLTLGDYTIGQMREFDIVVDTSGATPSYTRTLGWNADDETHTNYLSCVGSGYTNPFTPTQPYQPATKKYVDDHGVPTTGTTGYVLTKTANGYEWQQPAQPGVGDVIVSTQANNLFTSGMKIWGGTDANYQLLTPDDNTLYVTI